MGFKHFLQHTKSLRCFILQKLFYWGKYPVNNSGAVAGKQEKIINLFSTNIKSLFHFIRTRKGKWITLGIVAVIIYWLSLPSILFKQPSSTVLEDKNGNLLGAKIADDGQWRFPYSPIVSDKFERAIIQFEDKHFYYHPGINPISLVRALIQDVRAGKIKSGGSTLSMQLIRLSRKNKSRTLIEKLIEILLATRLEFSYSKKEILALYASNAPFGGNVVGLEAASWRYFGRSAKQLSWAETATLAVLPNSPSLIYPGKNQKKLLLKRNRLLDKLQQNGDISAESCELAKNEPLPGKPHRIPQLASHLLVRLCNDNKKGELIKTTLDRDFQERVKNIIEEHHSVLKGNEIHNAAAIVLDVKTGNVLAYVGNTENRGKEEHGNDVDVISAPRSTGSILKPFLYASMLNDGEILPNTLIPDIPTQIAGYSPQNYNLTYDGAVHAKRALSRSLNVPIVKMLQGYGIEKFNYMLKKIGITTINKPPDYYGLTIILGGAEAKLYDLAGMYASMARSLNHYTAYNRKYSEADYHPPKYIEGLKDDKPIELQSTGIIDAASIWLTFEAMVDVVRPDEDANWSLYTSSQKIAWKTGTSFGFRDGWAIGLTPKYVVAVWVGNADGEGRPGLIGIATAAPILFDIFSLLKPVPWFKKPYSDMVNIPVCRESGHRASPICENIDKVWIQKTGLKTLLCPYHKMIHLDASERFRVNSDCEPIASMIHKSWFVLPPSQESYYKSKNPAYRELPPYRSDCLTSVSNSMELIYPKEISKIYVPVELGGTIGRTVFEAVHRNPAITIYWHLDDKYIGGTKGIHQIGLNPERGKHTITLVDENGETLTRNFEIVGKEK